MSAGIVFVHHKYPLQLALNKVREAEKLAKSKYDRNSCCIKLIKNSGEERTIGFKWDSKDFFDKIIKMYNAKKISTKFAYDFMKIIKELNPEQNDGKINEIIRNELKRIYTHKQKKDKETDEFLKSMLEVFNKWQHSYVEFSNMFIIACFIAQSGMEA